MLRIANFGRWIGNVAILVVLVKIAPCWDTSTSFGDELDLKRVLSFASEYENTRFTGNQKIYRNGQLVEDKRFQVNIQSGKPGERPWEVLFIEGNPGEPHLDTKEIVDTAYAFDGKLGFYFRRAYVSKPPLESEKLSLVSVSTSPTLPQLIRESLFIGLDGMSPLEYPDLRGKEDKIAEIETIGHETYLGIDAMKVRFSLINQIGQDRKPVPPLDIELLVGTEPTIQVLKVISVNRGTEDLSVVNRGSYGQTREVKSARVIGNWLICDNQTFKFGENETRITIENVETLPNGYIGAFDYMNISGATYGGDAEKATRKGSGRKMRSHTEELSYIPHTDTEKAKIDDYLRSQGLPVAPRNQAAGLASWFFNLVVLGILGLCIFMFYRRAGTKSSKNL